MVLQHAARPISSQTQIDSLVRRASNDRHLRRTTRDTRSVELRARSIHQIATRVTRERRRTLTRRATERARDNRAGTFACGEREGR